MVRGHSKQEIVWINVRKLSIDPMTKRDYYEPEVFSKLAESISENGFKEEHPLVVRPNPMKRGHWLIVCGQHRFEAGIKRGIAEFPCIKREWLTDPIGVISEAYRDNVLRCEPDPITEAKYMHTLGLQILKKWGYKQKKIDSMKRKMPTELIARQLGEEVSTVKHRLRLLLLHPLIQGMISRYYMKTSKGLKLSPTIGSELVSIRQRLIEQKVENIDLELFRIALKCSRERLRFSDVRAMHTEIALRGFDNWKNKKIIADKSGVRCYFCGEKAFHEDIPWLPLCIEHKALLTTHKDEIERYLMMKEKEIGISKTPKHPPNAPLHVLEPNIHKLKDESKGVNAFNSEPEIPHERYPARTIFTKYNDFVIKKYSQKGLSMPVCIIKKLRELREIYPEGDWQDEQEWEREAYYNAHPEERSSFQDNHKPQ